MSITSLNACIHLGITCLDRNGRWYLKFKLNINIFGIKIEKAFSAQKQCLFKFLSHAILVTQIEKN